MNRWHLPLWLFVLLALGCGSNHGPLGKVEGTVQFKGQPLAKGAVLFEVEGQRPSQGKIVDGKIIEVTTYSPGDGVPTGHARIAVFAAEPEASNAAANPPTTPQEAWAANGIGMTAPKSAIPAKYGDLGASGLSHDITAGQNVVKLDLFN